MHAHTGATSQTDPKPQPADPRVSATAVTAMGTFAAGQSAHGSIHVAADADVGSFASGLDETAQSVTT